MISDEQVIENFTKQFPRVHPDQRRFIKIMAERTQNPDLMKLVEDIGKLERRFDTNYAWYNTPLDKWS